jgi:hypothetical protein
MPYLPATTYPVQEDFLVVALGLHIKPVSEHLIGDSVLLLGTGYQYLPRNTDESKGQGCLTAITLVHDESSQVASPE